MPARAPHGRPSLMADFPSRQELLAGLPARQATALLFAIEGQTGRMVERSRRRMQIDITGSVAEQREQAFFEALRQGRDLPVQPTIQQIERHATSWRHLMPDSPASRAGLARAIGRKYALEIGRAPGIRAAVGIDDEAVQQAYRRSFGAELQAAFTPSPSRLETVRWLAVDLARFLDTMSPFWFTLWLTVAFSLPMALLALPISLAQVGAGPGLLLLVGFGVLNTLSIAYIAEAAARFSPLQYGNAYVGQLVRDYLGSASEHALSATLAVRTSLVLLAAYVGFGLTFAASFGLPVSFWIVAIFSLTVAAVYSRSAMGGIAIVLLLSCLSLTLFVLIAGPALAAASLERLFDTPAGIVSAGGALGVIVMTYFGHVYVVQTAKIVLPRDPGGQAVIGGSVAGNVVIVAIVVAWVLALNGSVPADLLAAQAGTVLPALSTQFGPWMEAMGLVLTLLFLGLGALRSSHVLFNLVRERLAPTAGADAAGDGGKPPTTRRGAGRVIGTLPRRRAARRTDLQALTPLIAMFLTAQALVAFDVASFPDLIAVAGVSANTLVAGIFPALLVLASRRKGSALDGTAWAWLGHPFVVLLVFFAFASVIPAHGLFVWESGPARLWALALTVAIVTLAVTTLRGGALEARTIVELRYDQREGCQPLLNVSTAGRAEPSQVRLRFKDRQVQARTNRPLGGIEGLNEVLIELRETHATSLLVWAHRVTPEGDSLPISAAVEAVDGATAVRSARTHAGRCVIPRRRERLLLTLRIEEGASQ